MRCGHSTTRIFSLVLLLTLAACATPYFGHTKKVWDNLTVQQQQEVKAEYKDVIDTKNSQEHEDALAKLKNTVIYHGFRTE